MKYESDTSIQGIIHSLGLISEKDLLSNILECGVKKMGCNGGAAFSFNQASRRFAIEANTWGINKNIIMPCDSGIAGKALSQRQSYSIIYGEELKASFEAMDTPPVENLFAIVAMPVCFQGEIEALFCFDYFTGTVSLKGLEHLTQPFWQELSRAETGAAIHELRIHQAPGKILAAGQAVGGITERVVDFITEFQQSLADETPSVKPDLIYVQLVDPFRELIRTIHGKISSHRQPLISCHAFKNDAEIEDDITVDIVKHRDIEIISGFDPRFDENVFSRYDHAKYVRMWMPLFPFPSSCYSFNNHDCIRRQLDRYIRWETPSPMSQAGIMRKVGRWKKKMKPPSEIVYGTLEVGFKQKKSHELSLAPFDPELAVRMMARAYDTSAPLYESTLPGVMDRIGQIVANVQPSGKTRLCCHYPNNAKSETREYPIAGVWPAPTPMIDRSTEVGHQQTGERQDLACFKNERVSICWESSENHGGECTPDNNVIPEIFQRNANEAMKTAFRLYELVMKPLELMEDQVREASVGTLIHDSTLASFRNHTAQSVGAVFAIYQVFRKIYSPDAEHKNKCLEARPPSGCYYAETLDDQVKKQIDLIFIKSILKDVVDSGDPVYDESYITVGHAYYPLCIFPLELSDGSMGGLGMVFSGGCSMDESSRLSLESQIPYWAHRLSMHHLTWYNNFSRMMMKLRRDTIQAGTQGKTVDFKGDPVETFLETVSKQAIKHFKAKAAVVSRLRAPASGPERLQMNWCLESEEDPCGKMDCFEVGLMRPWLDVVEKNEVSLIDSVNDPQLIVQLEGTFTSFSTMLVSLGQASDGEHLWELASIFNSTEECISILSFRITQDLSSEISSGQDVSCISLVLSGEHYVDANQRHMISEWGTLIGHHLSGIQLFVEKEMRERYSKCIVDPMIRLEQSQTIDQIVDIFLKGLAGRSSGRATKPDDSIGVADEIVLWTMSPGSQELIIRSASGYVLDDIRSQGHDIVNHGIHPFFSQEKADFIQKKGRCLVYKEDFKFLSFRLDDQNVQRSSDLLKYIYKNTTRRKWMFSFPLIDAAKRISGVVDFFRDEALSPEEELAVREALKKLTRRLTKTAERIKLQASKRIIDQLFLKTKQLIEDFKINETYKSLVEIVKNEFKCSQCDLLVERGGLYYLYASTGKYDPEDEKDRAKYWLTESLDMDDFLNQCILSKIPSVCHNWNFDLKLKHYSPELKTFFKNGKEERLVFPLRILDSSNTEKPEGLIQLHGPDYDGNNGDGNRVSDSFKKNNRFSIDDYLLAREIGLGIRRIVKMVQLAEQQIWLVNLLAHSLGQPLQVLWSQQNGLIRALNRLSHVPKEIKALVDGIHHSYDFVQDAMQQLSHFTGASLLKQAYENEDLAELIRRCCVFMAETARRNDVRIVYGGVNDIAPLPIVKPWMRLVIINLLDNACKYSWRSRDVDVSLREDKTNISITVQNIGIGIPPEDSGRIFQPFFRSKVKDSKRDRAGMGMGLFIAKKGVEIVHQGRLVCQSNPINRADLLELKETGNIQDKICETRLRIELYRDRLKDSVKKFQTISPETRVVEETS